MVVYNVYLFDSHIGIPFSGWDRIIEPGFCPREIRIQCLGGGQSAPTHQVKEPVEFKT